MNPPSSYFPKCRGRLRVGEERCQAEGAGAISDDSNQLAGDVVLMLTTLDRIANTLDAIADGGLRAWLGPSG